MKNALKLFYVFIFHLGTMAYATPNFKHVMIVVLENTDYSSAINQSFLAELSKKGASLDNMTALTHPSQGNYIAMIAGDTFGIINDKNITLDAHHLGDLLEAKGLTWKVYAEDYPGNCFLGATNGKYARKHVPFLSFKNVSTNSDRCRNIVSVNQLTIDLKMNSLPNYSIYIPNLNNDGHDTGASFADAYLSKTFGPLIHDPVFMSQMLFVVTFDESESKNNNNQIYTALFGDAVIAGAKSKKAYDHYSILKMIELTWDLGSLSKKDLTSSAIDDVFR